MYVTPNLTIVKKPQLKIGMLGVSYVGDFKWDSSSLNLPTMYLERDMRTKDRSEDYITRIDYIQNTEFIPLCETKDGKYWAIGMDGQLVKADL